MNMPEIITYEAETWNIGILNKGAHGAGAGFWNIDFYRVVYLVREPANSFVRSKTYPKFHRNCVKIGM